MQQRGPAHFKNGFGTSLSGLPPESFLFLQPNYLVEGMIAQILLKSNLAEHLSIINPQNLDTSLLLSAITPGKLFPIKVSQGIRPKPHAKSNLNVLRNSLSLFDKMLDQPDWDRGGAAISTDFGKEFAIFRMLILTCIPSSAYCMTVMS